MRVNRWVMPILAVLLLVATVGAAQAAGLWATTGRQLSGSGGGGGGGGGQGDGAGTGSAQVVKGWMTLQEAADAVGLPVRAVAELTGALEPASLDPATALNQLEDVVPGFTMSTFRTALMDAASGPAP